MHDKDDSWDTVILKGKIVCPSNLEKYKIEIKEQLNINGVHNNGKDWNDNVLDDDDCFGWFSEGRDNDVNELSIPSSIKLSDGKTIFVFNELQKEATHK